ncbi:MAG: hypothetical protein ACXIUM_04685 [Wenzhouxiangella sp.]
MSAQAQTCTITNWQGGAVNAGALFAGNPTQGNPRYAGPCSLRVDIDGALAYVVDDSPVNEPDYITRFYFNPNGNSTAPKVIFAATDSAGDDVLQLWYNVASADPFTPQPNHVTLVAFTDGGTRTIEAGATSIRPNGWNSFEIVWGAGADASITLKVNAEADRVLTNVNNTTVRISEALLGLVGPASAPTTSAPMFFDDFDSRRQTRPGRLCRGLTNEARDGLTLEDGQAIFTEFSSDGAILAAGQPDFNEDGFVNLEDGQAVFVRFSTDNGACELNR